MVRYCHRCGAVLGLLNGVYSSTPLSSPYQLTKYMKHIVPDPLLPVVSVFESTHAERYEQYVVDTAASGLVEIDGAGRRNLVWLAGHRVGFRYEQGTLVGPQDAVKVVLSSDPGKIHAFPVSAAALTTVLCARCKGLIST